MWVQNSVQSSRLRYLLCNLTTNRFSKRHIRENDTWPKCIGVPEIQIPNAEHFRTFEAMNVS